MIKRLVCFSIFIMCMVLTSCFGNETKYRSDDIISNDESDDIQIGSDEKVSTIEIVYNVGTTECETVASFLSTRLNSSGMENHCFHKTRDNYLILTVFGVQNSEDVIGAIGSYGVISFVDSEGVCILNNNHIVSADTVEDPVNGSFAINLTFTDEGRRLFAEATERVSGLVSECKNYIEIRLNDQVLFSPSVYNRIDNSECVLNGAFSKQDTDRIVSDIRAGIILGSLTLSDIKACSFYSGDVDRFSDYSGWDISLDLQKDEITYDDILNIKKMFNDNGYKDFIIATENNNSMVSVFFNEYPSLEQRYLLYEIIQEADFILMASNEIENLAL